MLWKDVKPLRDIDLKDLNETLTNPLASMDNEDEDDNLKDYNKLVEDLGEE
jgi:hypothetical protein